MQNLDVKIISSTDNRYPKVFRELSNPPKNIYALGNIGLLNQKPAVCIVGTRKASPYGKSITIKLSRTIAAHGVPVISGLAYGIDSSAHIGALEVGGPTIAVLPGSLTHIYPMGNYGLAKRIVMNDGLLISEYGSDNSPQKYQFLERNRIMAALCSHAVVPEASSRSGSNYTVETALELGRSVGAVPGNIDSPLSASPNRLLKQGAEPILSTDDLLLFMGIDRQPKKTDYVPADKNEKRVLDVLSSQASSNDSLINETGLPIAQLNICMTTLEIKGIVAYANNKWSMVSH